MAKKPTKKELLKLAKGRGLDVPKKVTVEILLDLLEAGTPPKPEAVTPGPVAPQPLSPEPKPKVVCDTCRKMGGTISKCLQCGKSYCTLCRAPYKGRYSNCQHCGAHDY